MKNIRNIAIIAHVDHGKTTLVNQLLVSSGTFRDNEEIQDRMMDNNDIERERGITILAKPTAINYKDYRINILDTPGHADFGGEVERIMHMVDGCLLVVDAFEGTMPQTRFVLKKALEAHIKPIVVVNKVDRPNADPARVVDEVLDLFIELGADDDLLEFNVIYASALKGTSSLDASLDSQKEGMEPILDAIINEIPGPDVDEESPLQFQPALLDYNDYVGKIGIGRIAKGKIHINDMVTCCRLDGTTRNFRIQKLYGFFGMKRLEVEEAGAGDIIGIAGLPDLNVGETICNLNNPIPLPILRIDEPTLQMTFGTNSSPFSGREGKELTARKIEDRLFREAQRDVSLKVERIPNSESWTVSGRGELHLSVLIENMRRQGFELEVSKPQVIIKEIDGERCEPYEDVQIDCPEEFMGNIMESLGSRGAELVHMNYDQNQVRIQYVIPSRGLLGFMTNFMTLKEYRPCLKIAVGERKVGVLVSTDSGMATGYALQHVEERGTLFIEPGADVYEGMIVGENKYDSDLCVTPVKEKNLTNQRSSNKDSTIVLKGAKKMSLEECLDYINTDELVEITPLSIRMRKKILNTADRKKYEAKMRSQQE